jgi:asparagine synthase (glutamine-hydrolysing)
MCGIGGWLGGRPEDPNVEVRMVKALYHRGPDGHGIKSWPEASLVHTRLSIIDLSQAGAQPIANQNGRIWCTFNGEIYNHHDLRRELEAKGHVFRGRSDSEVLPHLYEEDGPSFVEKLRGMFALALYDTRNRRLLLARDRFGIKPLFYAAHQNRLAFASEILALLEVPDIDTCPNRQAIFDFAALYYIPAPETFYIGIRALEPGEVLEAQWNGEAVDWRIRRYHQWSITPDIRMTLKEAVERTEALVTTAVHRQLESDVPIGSLLSGGIDSSVISAIAQRTGNGINTFNVKFPEERFDETWAAVAVAEHIGSHHTTLSMDTKQGTWEQINTLLLHPGQPFADVSFFAVNAVCRLMRKSITVALSGDGGDEVFGGYDIYSRLARIARWKKLPAPVWYGGALALFPFGHYGRRLSKRMNALAQADDTSVIQSMYCWLGEEEHAALCRDRDLLPVRRLFEPQWDYHLPAHADRLERLSAHATEVGMRLTLANDYLFKVDAASMKESLEVRVPMLDEDLVAFGLSLPHNLKVQDGTCKRVLRAVACRMLPTAIATKPKWGFAVPLSAWVDAEFKVLLRDTLLGPSSRISEYFRPAAYTKIVEDICDLSTRREPANGEHQLRTIMLLAAQLALTRRQ